MKKALTLLLAAALSGLASAVTLTWSATEVTSANRTVASNHPNATSYSVALVFTINDLSQWSSSAGSVLTWTHNNGGPNATINANATGTSTKSTTTVSNTSAAFKEGENILGIALTISGNNLSYQLFVNGIELTSGGKLFQNGASYPQLQNVVVGSMISSGTVYTTKGVATADDFAKLPEPTVLSLLAIGVAGLALRRKQA